MRKPLIALGITLLLCLLQGVTNGKLHPLEPIFFASLVYVFVYYLDK